MQEELAIDLPWEGPFNFCTLLTDQKIKERFAKPGIYLWIVDQPGGTKIIYIGKASGKPNLVKRQIEQYRSYISGASGIPAWALKSKTRWKADWEKK